MQMKWCLMSSGVGWHLRDKLRPMPKHGSINLYIHGSQKAHKDGQPRMATSTLTQLLTYVQHADVSVSTCMCVCAACSWYTHLILALAHRNWWMMQRAVARGWQLLQPLSTACLGRGSAGRSRAKSSRNRSSGTWWGCRKEFREQIFSEWGVGKSSGNRSSVMGVLEIVQGTDHQASDGGVGKSSGNKSSVMGV